MILTMANGDFSENLATVWGFRLPSKWAHCLEKARIGKIIDRLNEKGVVVTRDATIFR